MAINDSITGQPINTGAPATGLRSVGAYQVSGHPFITGSANLDAAKCHMIEFDYVSKSFTVINTNTDAADVIRVHFVSGSGTTEITVPGEAGTKAIADASDVINNYHFITVPAGNGSVTFDTRCKRFYISNRAAGNANLSYEVMAELTTIPAGRMFELTGSGITV